jgi:hypothetical protein
MKPHALSLVQGVARLMILMGDSRASDPAKDGATCSRPAGSILRHRKWCASIPVFSKFL